MLPSAFAFPVPFWSMNPTDLATMELLTSLPDVGLLRSGMQEVRLWTEVIDGRGTFTELFSDLPALLAAVDLEDAHLCTTFRLHAPVGGPDHA